MSVSLVTVEREERIAVVRVNRPDALNALNTALMEELLARLRELDGDPTIGAIVLTGDDRAFSAGADLRELGEATAVSFAQANHLRYWDEVGRLWKPIVAAVSGFALGGGLELALACDLIVASETARLGQPEIKVGVIPGAGGTQRLTRAVGRRKALEMILLGEPITAQEALEYGLVNRVTPREVYLEEAKRLARELANRAPLAVQLAKEAVRQAEERGLEDGLAFERRSFFLTFATEDKQEGIQAFLEKRPPRFRGQ